MKNKLIESFPAYVPSAEHIENFNVGFFEGRCTTPSGRKWIVSADDLEGMYGMFDPGSEIVLWCDAKVANEPSQSKRKAHVQDEAPVSKRAKKEEEIDSIKQKLSKNMVINLLNPCISYGPV